MIILRIIECLVLIFMVTLIAAQLRLMHFRSLILERMNHGEDYTLRELKKLIKSDSSGVWVALQGLVKDGHLECVESGRYELYRLKD